MEKEKIIGAGKQDNQPQDKFANELLSNDELDNVAGGTTGPNRPNSNYLFYEANPHSDCDGTCGK